jgi:hypothetical protein
MNSPDPLFVPTPHFFWSCEIRALNGVPSKPLVPDPLLEWNRLNRENAKNSLVSVMFGNISGRAVQIDLFSTWLLAGSGAAATLVVGNAQSLIALLGKYGFRRGLAALVSSAFFGLISKYIYIFFQYGGDYQTKLLEQVQPILDKHALDEKQIQEIAKKRNIKLDTEISMNHVLSDFSKPFPKISRKFMLWYINKHRDDPQIGHLLPLKTFMWQATAALIQAIAFIAFLIVVIYNFRIN